MVSRVVLAAGLEELSISSAFDNLIPLVLLDVMQQIGHGLFFHEEDARENFTNTRV
jgi:hypothetical protein